MVIILSACASLSLFSHTAALPQTDDYDMRSGSGALLSPVTHTPECPNTVLAAHWLTPCVD